MFNPASSVPVDCHVLLHARLAGGVALGLAVAALEAWLRVPVRPLLDGCFQEAHARAAAFFRHLSF